MADLYSNLPINSSNSNAMVKAYDSYINAPLEVETSTYNTMRGFFSGKGFDEKSSEAMSMIIIRQAKQDGYSPMTILDTLKGFDSVEISALVSEILNFNRFKSSFLGYARQPNTPDTITRNILA